MTQRSIWRAGVVFWLSAAVLWPAMAVGEGFLERFDQGPAGNKWVFGADPARSLRWAADPAAKCLEFASAASATAHAPWAVGQGSFELEFDLRVASAHKQPWRFAGVLLGLSSSPPDQWKDDTLVIYYYIHLEGITAGACTGVPYSKTSRQLAPRYQLSMSGAGGHQYSVQWPSKDVRDMDLRLRIERSKDRRLRFSIYRTDELTVPWWEGELDLNSPANRGVAALGKGPLNYIFIRTKSGMDAALADRDGAAPAQDRVGGTFTAIRGRLADDPPMQRPAVAKVADAGLAPGEVRPYLWYTKDELADLRKKFNEPMFKDYRTVILRYADDPSPGKVTEPGYAETLWRLGWGYVLTGNPAYKKRCLEAVDELLVGTDRIPACEHGRPGKLRRHLNIDEFFSSNAEAIATVYDILFDEIPPPQRARMKRFLEQNHAYYLNRLAANDWWYANNPSNTIAVGNGNGGFVALALKHSQPNWESTVKQAVDNMFSGFRGLEDDGGYVEGVMYWNYALSHQVMLGRALLRTTGDDRGLLTHPAHMKARKFVEAMLAGNDTMLCFNDSQPWLNGLVPIVDVGSRTKDPLLLWLADHIMANAAADPKTPPEVVRPHYSIMAFLFRDRTPAPAECPPLPTLAVLPSLHSGVMRSDSAYKPRLLAGIKGRDGALTHHANADQGSYIVHALGEEFLLDPGYFQGNADMHSLPLINGHGPDPKGVAKITSSWEKGDLRCIVVDSGPAYRGAAPQRPATQPVVPTGEFGGLERLRRTFVMAGSDALVILDDVVPRQKATVTALYQCAAAPAARGTSATIARSNGSMVLKTYGPKLDLKVLPRPWSKDWVYARTGTKWHTLWGDYTPEADNPLITVLLPVAKGAAGPAVDVKRTDGQIAVTVGAHKVVFRKDSGAWTCPQ